MADKGGQKVMGSVFDRMANRAAATVLSSYSTSFSLATRLLAEPARTDITNLYAVVRIADELVDGAGAQSGLSPAEIRAKLDDFEAQVLAAPNHPLHTDPILHAYALSARRCGFAAEHLQAFFASMRRDLLGEAHDKASLGRYIYGSAEVIGLLCLAAFLGGQPPTTAQENAARSLGAAFQKINFLRDVADDSQRLGRTYVLVERKAALAEIREDLAQARPGVAALPASVRTGVLVATNLFSALAEELATADLHRRVRLPATRKALIVAASIRQARRMGVAQ